jgi:hypothetical protein
LFCVLGQKVSIAASLYYAVACRTVAAHRVVRLRLLV